MRRRFAYQGSMLAPQLPLPLPGALAAVAGPARVAPSALSPFSFRRARVRGIAAVGLLTVGLLVLAAPAGATERAQGALVRAGQASPNPNGLLLNVLNEGTQTITAIRYSLAGGATFNLTGFTSDRCTLSTPSQIVCTTSSPPGNIDAFGFQTSPRYPNCAGGTLAISVVDRAGPFVTVPVFGPGNGETFADTFAVCQSVTGVGVSVPGKQSGAAVRGRVLNVPVGSNVRVDLLGGAARRAAARQVVLGTGTRREVRSATVHFKVKLNARGRLALARSRTLRLTVRVTTTLGGHRSVRTSRTTLSP